MTEAVDITVRPLAPAHLLQTLALLQSQGWAARVPSAEYLQRLLAASSFAFVALHQGEVIGLVRGLSDGMSNGYLSMLVGHPHWRRRGVGRRLVQTALDTAPEITWLLRAGRPGAAEFFARLGFEASAEAMERRRLFSP